MAHNSIFTKIFKSTSGISVSEIAKALGVCSGDVGRLCCHRNINKDAKYKPLSGVDSYELTETDRKAKNYGYEYLPYYTTIQQMANDVLDGKYIHAVNYDAFKTPWGYINLGEGDKYRVLDFDGYNHAAKFFCKKITSDLAWGGDPDEDPISPLDKPVFIAPLEEYDEGTIWGNDIALYDKDGRKVRDASSVYVGIMVCRRSTIAVPTVVASNTTNIFTPTCERLVVDSGLQVPRGDSGSGVHFVSVTACLVLSDRKINATDAIDATNKGFYVPVIPTRSEIQFFVEGIEPHLSFDSVMPWYKDGNDVYVTWYAKPNGSFGQTSLNLTLTTNGGALVWGHCVWSDNIPMPYVEDDDQHQVLVRYRAKFETSTLLCRLHIDSVNDDTTEMDTPLFVYDYSTPITDGEVLDGEEFDESEVGNIALVEAVLGTSELGWTQMSFAIG